MEKPKYVMMKHALDADGKLIDIKDATTGKECNCTCIVCGGKVIAKNKSFEGRKKDIFFAHEGTNTIHENESYLHILTKEIIRNACVIAIPLTRDKRILLNHKPDMVTLVAFQLRLSEVFLEKGLEGCDIVPDVTAYLDNGICVLVEVVVTHDIDEKKMSVFEGLNRYPVLRIDLSEVARSISEEDLFEAICKTGKYSEWVYFPHREPTQKQVAVLKPRPRIPTRRIDIDQLAERQSKKSYYSYSHYTRKNYSKKRKR